MTLIEASRCFRISLEKLTWYEENGLIVYETLVNEVPDYTEDELRKVGIIHDLMKAGMDADVLRKYLQLLRQKACNKDEQIRLLRKQRCRLLEEIHCKQQSLDALDYMIDAIRRDANPEIWKDEDRRYLV